MITDKIKALFNFIEFLHSNIDNFKQYDSLINELYSLDIERNNVKPLNNFADKLKYDEIQSIILDKFKTIQSNIIQPIQDKSNELNICDWNKTETLWNYNILEISELKDNFTANDIPEIQKHKNKYIEFRTVTNCTYFNRFFFNDLDQTLKVLFDFFKESTENEFEAFETKKIMVNNISEAVELLRTKTTNVKDFEKDELFKNTVFFYTSIRFNKDNLKGVFSKNYETKDDFLKTLYSENTRIFFRSAIIQKNEDFVKSINNEFMLFCTYNSVTTEIKESWLKKTYQFITKVNDLSEFIDKPTVCLFVNWYNETLNNLTSEKTNKEAKDYKEYPWFKIGLKLATGEAFELYHKYKLDKGHFVKLCLELGFKKTERPYFSETINDSKKRITDKNIFANKDKLQKLHKHLTENNLPFGTKFLEKYNQIETE